MFQSENNKQQGTKPQGMGRVAEHRGIMFDSLFEEKTYPASFFKGIYYEEYAYLLQC